MAIKVTVINEAANGQEALAIVEEGNIDNAMSGVIGELLEDGELQSLSFTDAASMLEYLVDGCNFKVVIESV